MFSKEQDRNTATGLGLEACECVSITILYAVVGFVSSVYTPIRVDVPSIAVLVL